MKIIFAQGNPGKPYERTRHNVGFMALDSIAEKMGSEWRTVAKFNAEIAEVTLTDEKVLLVKPLSFYNETGRVARAVVDFYKVDATKDVLVIHDELALPFGTIRIREKGSDAGNNGIKSLTAHLGPLYPRIRVGVWNELRDKMDDAAFVLSGFSKDETEMLSSKLIPIIHDLVEDFAAGTLSITSHTVTS